MYVTSPAWFTDYKKRDPIGSVWVRFNASQYLNIVAKDVINIELDERRHQDGWGGITIGIGKTFERWMMLPTELL